MLSAAFAKPHTPAAGSAERKAILDALRVPVQREAGQKIVFYNVTIRVENGWAWVLAVSKDKTGKKMPLGDTMTQGLMHKVKGRWRVEHWGLSSDISVACAAAKAFPKAPRAIFGGVLGAC
jgi:hypothetical protein